jgi:SNF2 family DNA or RNA helicase
MLNYIKLHRVNFQLEFQLDLPGNLWAPPHCCSPFRSQRMGPRILQMVPPDPHSHVPRQQSTQNKIKGNMSPQIHFLIFQNEEFLYDKFDVCITNYESIKTEKHAFGKFVWRYIITDEAHRIKSDAADISTAMRRLRSQYKLLLTGTPLQNNLHELWCLLEYMFADIFDNPKAFDSVFDLGTSQVNKDKLFLVREPSRAFFNEKVSGLLEPFMLRRMKKDVSVKLPEKTEIKVYVPLTHMQTEVYKSILSNNVELLKALALKGSSAASKLLNLLMQLRKVCDHPYLFDLEPEPHVPGEHLVNTSGIPQNSIQLIIS